MNYIVVNGAPLAGKDTFVDYVISEINKKENHLAFAISSVDFVKELAYQCGWDGKKTPKNRKFLSDLKDLLTEWNDVPMREILEGAEELARSWDGVFENFWVFVMIREPAEIKKFVEQTDAVTLCIRREAVEKQEQSNHADAQVLNFPYNFQINNNGTLTDLKEMAKLFAERLLNLKESEGVYH